MLKNRILYAVGLVAAVIFVLFSWVWIAVFILLIVLLLPVISIAVSAGMIKNIKYEIAVPASAPRDEPFSITICDRSSGMIPDYAVELEVENCCGEKIEWIADLNSGERRIIRMQEEHCGTVRCHIKNVYACDYLGLFRFRLPRLSGTATAVMPQPVPPSPLPSISQIIHTSFRPKYGGGFAEVHDMREYRPGDLMRDIHWKLSAKTDRLIVREPQVPDRKLTLITIDLLPASHRMDRRFEHLAWVSGWLCCNETEHEVRWIEPQSREIKSFTVKTKDDSEKMLRQVLSERVTGEMPSISNITFTDADWHYHIGGEVQT